MVAADFQHTCDVVRALALRAGPRVSPLDKCTAPKNVLSRHP